MRRGKVESAKLPPPSWGSGELRELRGEYYLFQTNVVCLNLAQRLVPGLLLLSRRADVNGTHKTSGFPGRPRATILALAIPPAAPPPPPTSCGGILNFFCNER